MKRCCLDDEYPDLSKHNNIMAKVLTKEMYGRLSMLSTPNGVTVDKVIQTGVDNPGTVQGQGQRPKG